MAANPNLEPEFVDTRRDIDRYLGNYAEDHRNETNQLIHWICVPPIVWTVVAFLWLIPVPAAIGKPGLWAALAAVGAMGFYIRLSKKLAIAMFAVLVAYLAITYLIHAAIGPTAMLWTAVAVFVVAWIGQFIGHQIEGARPSFFTDVTYLLVGPIYLMGKVFRRLGISY